MAILRQIVAVGGNPEKIAILDNFCWGNTDKPDRLGGLVRASQACYDVAMVYETPFISGKDSLNNEYQVNGKSISIPPTLLISAISVMEDVRQAISMDAKQAGNLIYILGETKNEMGGSHYYLVRGITGNEVPNVDAHTGKRLMQALHRAMTLGLVKACHDCSEGGLGVAAAEMAFAGGIGMTINLARVPASMNITKNDILLFSESNSRFLVEIAPEDKNAFEKIVNGNVFANIGTLTDTNEFIVVGVNGREVVRDKVDHFKESWQKTLRDF
jgi:phosphoribosylformylglycinamidine synthase